MNDRPNYDITIDVDELLADLVEMSQDVAEERDEYRKWHREELERGYDICPQYRYWVREQTGLLTAFSRAIACLQPEQHEVMCRCFREPDGSVDVRAFMRWLKKQADRAHEIRNERRNAPQANKAETGYCRVISLLRDDYGVGWPRLDDVSGTPIKEDLP